MTKEQYPLPVPIYSPVMTEQQRARWRREAPELSPEDARGISHILYPFILGFSSPYHNEILEQLRGESSSWEVSVFDSPAARYIEKFGFFHGINPNALQKWLDLTSRELARSYLPVFKSKRRHSRKIGILDNNLNSAQRWSFAIDEARAIIHGGLDSTLESHRYFVVAMQHTEFIPDQPGY